MFFYGYFSFFAILIFIKGGTSFEDDFYWKEYTGTVPRDAIVGGLDIYGQDTFIGQAYDQDVGLIPVQIYLGVAEVAIPIYGEVKSVTDYIKILCGPQQESYWLSTNASDILSNLQNKHAVIGGHIYGSGEMNIGRIVSGGVTKIGRILTYDVNNPNFFYNNDGIEGSRDVSYDVLVYKN